MVQSGKQRRVKEEFAGLDANLKTSRLSINTRHTNLPPLSSHWAFYLYSLLRGRQLNHKAPRWLAVHGTGSELVMASCPPISLVAAGLDRTKDGPAVLSSEAIPSRVPPPPTEALPGENAEGPSSRRSPGVSATPASGIALRPRKISLAERRSGTHDPLPQIDVVRPALFDLNPHRHQQRGDIQNSAEVAPAILLEERSTPIAIPVRPKDNNISRPTTPLTARNERSGHWFPFDDITPKRPQISQSLRPSYQHHRAPPDRSPNLNNLSPSRKQYISRSAATMSTHPYHPSSPLSPIMSTVPYSSSSQYDFQRAPAHNLHIPTLPRFHPANYQSPNSSSINSPNRTRQPSYDRPPRSPQLSHRQFSDAQQKVHQYQREVIANATRMSSIVAPIPVKPKKPKTPLLMPCGSPGTGPATPLTLEDTDDYMLAGLEKSQSTFGNQELVDKLIREEHDRISGVHSGRNSPAISPAGGRC